MKYTLLIATVLLLLNYTLGQNQDIRFKHYTVNEGLSHNTARTILQDSKGFLWIGTDDGLNLFDGYKFFWISFLINLINCGIM